MDYDASVVEDASASDDSDALFATNIIAEAACAREEMHAQVQHYLTPTTFRLMFPVFKDSSIYPDSQVGFYILMGAKLLRPERWHDMLREGISLFTAHFLSLDRLASTQPGGMAGIPGTAVGVINSGTVDKVSFGKDVASVMEDGAGHWGMTTYGMQYLRFARMFGMGPIQLGAGPDAGPVVVGFGRNWNFPQSAYIYAGSGAQVPDPNNAGAWPGPYSTFPYEF